MNLKLIILLAQEQPMNDECKYCGAPLTGSANTRFWEGGKGCRDTSKLSRKDSHKFKNQSKTVSQKQKRVGEKTK